MISGDRKNIDATELFIANQVGKVWVCGMENHEIYGQIEGV